MPNYKYTAKNSAGKKVHGTREAADETALYQALKLEGTYLVTSQNADSVRQKGQGKLKNQVLIDFCRQLGTLLGAGVTLVRALNIIAEEEGLKPAYKAVYLDLIELIRQGIPLSDAMERQGKAFPILLVSMMRSAEANGNLDQTARRMATHYEKERKLNGKVVSAMIYPMILSGLLVLVVIFILVFLVPQFQDIFDQMETLPMPTVILLGLSNGIKQHWMFILLILAVVVIGAQMLFRIPAVHLWKDHMKLRIPVIGKLLKKIYTARFARTLSSLYSSGLPIVAALQIGSTTIGNVYLESQFGGAIARVRSGEPLSKALKEIEGFQQKLSSTVLVGEETGSLDEMLDAMAESFDFEAEKALEKLVTLLEPVLIVVMGVVVGFVVVAVILPIYQSY
ncbi:MAG: type II secretion system F family protein, partial [Lachnospiraceae bacterium]